MSQRGRTGRGKPAPSSSDLARELLDDDFPTVGHVVEQVVVAHTAYHAGQLAVWRRAMGKESVAVFVRQAKTGMSIHG